MVRPVDLEIHDRLSSLRDPSGCMTTGQVAKLFGVAPRTAGNWLERKIIEGFRLPIGMRERRFIRSSVFRVALEYGYPVSSNEFYGFDMIGVGLSNPDSFENELPNGSSLRVVPVAAPRAISFELGFRWASSTPDICILESTELGIDLTKDLARHLSRSNVPVLGISPDCAELADTGAFTTLLPAPCEPARVFATATELSGA